jgi:hypothetical protein
MAKFTLDDKTRRELLNTFPFGVDSVYSFTPDFMEKTPDKYPRELWPVFQVKPFSKPDRIEARKLYIDVQHDKPASRDKIGELARKYTVGWSNVIAVSNGEEILFKAGADGGADTNLFDAMPEIYVTAIWHTLIRISGLVGSELAGLGY